MKIGIITDIHGNNEALNAVLQEFEKREVKKIICCGDIIGIGPRPEEVLQELIQKKDTLIAVRGNHEQYLLKGLPEKVHNENRGMSPEEIENHKWNHNRISKESKEFLYNLPIEINLEIENKKIYIVHYPINENGECKRHIKKATLQECKEMFKEIDADIVLYGHTHQMNVCSENGKWYINSGSLGCPTTNKIANAGILTIMNGKVEFEHLEVKYNVDEVIKDIKNIKFPFYKKVLEIFYGVHFDEIEKD